MISATELKKDLASLTWVDHDRLDLRRIPGHHRLEAPALLAPGATHEEAIQILEKALCFEHGSDQVCLKSPIEDVDIKRVYLPHTVEKRLDARERYGLFIRPTIETPYEIWRKDEGNGFKHHYIAAFTGKNDVTVSIRIDQDGNILWNFMQRDGRRMNGLREGDLLYCR